MYPAQVDCWRLLERLVRAARVEGGLTEAAAAHAAGMSQSAWARIETLSKAAAEPKRRVSRNNLLQALSWGLKIKEQELFDAILWLYDGHVASPEELDRYVRYSVQSPQPIEYRRETLKRIVISNLKAWRERLMRDGGGRNNDLRIFMTENELVDAARHIFELESQPGHRILINRTPTYFLSSSEVTSHVNPKVKNEDLRGEFANIWARRSEIFWQHAKIYGDRCVLSEEGLLEYLLTDKYVDTTEEKGNLMKNLLQYLYDNPLCEIRLAKSIPPLTLSMKVMGPVILHPPGGTREELFYDWDPIFFYLEKSEAHILQLQIMFEEVWDKFGEEQSANRGIDRLERFLYDIQRNNA